MRSTVRAAVPAATAMDDLADLGYRFAIGPKNCAVSESESFFPHRESSLTIRADVDASVCLDEHTLDDPSRYRAVRAPCREEDSVLDLSSGTARDQEKESDRRPPHAPNRSSGTGFESLGPMTSPPMRTTAGRLSKSQYTAQTLQPSSRNTRSTMKSRLALLVPSSIMIATV